LLHLPFQVWDFPAGKCDFCNIVSTSKKQTRSKPSIHLWPKLCHDRRPTQGLTAPSQPHTLCSPGPLLRIAEATELFRLGVLQVPKQSCSSRESMTCHDIAQEINAPDMLNTLYSCCACHSWRLGFSCIPGEERELQQGHWLPPGLLRAPW